MQMFGFYFVQKSFFYKVWLDAGLVSMMDDRSIYKQGKMGMGILWKV